MNGVTGGELRHAERTVWAYDNADVSEGLRIERRRERRGQAWELTAAYVNESASPVRIESLDALDVRIADGADWTATWFTSAWGSEFEPVSADVTGGLLVEVSSGRSSHGAHPILILSSSDVVVIVAIAWSGNWRFEIDERGVLRGGVSPRDFGVVLEAGEKVNAPSVFVATGAGLAEAGRNLAGAIGHLIPRTVWSDSMPTEWNHWWPYEDLGIDESTFLEQARAAGALGVELATLDAGWFGSSEIDSDWQQQRGDWTDVNLARFPSGLAALADATRAAGVEFGIWIEPEALGAGARTRTELPEIVATRSRPDASTKITVSLDPSDPTFLGYVCLGSPAGRDFVARSLSTLIGETGARWVKIDFNVDPGSGCDRTDHGHGADDGLFRHYEGLYQVLDAFRAQHPEVIVESCSSGGLRLDLGIARHVHCQFLSDLDWTEHHLQVLWATALWLPPAGILHWSWSQWRGEHPDQRRELAALTAAEFDREIRAAMLHRFGISFVVTDLAPHLGERLAAHVADYRRLVAPILRRGVLSADGAQPLRHGRGERRPTFQVDDERSHLVASFDLDARGGALTTAWSRLDPTAVYDVEEIAGNGPRWSATGSELMSGVTAAGCLGWRSRGVARIEWLPSLLGATRLQAPVESSSADHAVTAAAADHACGRQAAGYGTGDDDSAAASPENSSGIR